MDAELKCTFVAEIGETGLAIGDEALDWLSRANAIAGGRGAV